MSTFAERIKQLRKEKNLTQDELAQHFFLNKSSISKYENGKHTPENDLLQKFADYFDVNIDYLLGRTDVRKSVKVNLEEGSGATIKAIDYLKNKQAETLAEEFLDMLIKHHKIKTKKDLTPQNVLKFVNEILDEIDTK